MGKKKKTYGISVRKIAEDRYEAEVTKPIAKVTAQTGKDAINAAEQVLATRIYVKDLKKQARKGKKGKKK